MGISERLPAQWIDADHFKGREISVCIFADSCYKSAVSKTISIRLSEDLDRWLEEESRMTGLPKGRIVREQLEALRTRKARQPFLDLAGSVEGEPGLSSKKGFRA